MRKVKTIRTKLLIAVCILFIVLIGTVWCIYQYIFSKYAEQESDKNIELLIQQTNKAVESSMSMIESSVEYFFMDKTLQEWMSMEDPSPNDELFGKLNMDEALQHSLMANRAWENDLIGAAYFYVDEFAFTFYFNGNLPIHELTQETKAIAAKMRMSKSEELQVFLPKGDSRTFFVSKSYVDEKIEDKTLNLIIAVDESKLVEEYEALTQYKGAEAYLIDEKGRIYSSSGNKKIGESIGDNFTMYLTDGRVEETATGRAGDYISGQKISQTGLWLVTKIPKDSYAVAMTQIARQYVLIICGVLLGILALGMFAIYKGTGFLAVIEKRFVAVKNGDYSAKLPDFETSELHELSCAFNGMTEQINYLVHEVYEKEIEVKKAELGFLQSQINPHFLFNTFAAISTKAKIAHQEEIYRMLRALSTLLEASFRPNAKGTVSVKKELEYVECYLYIQKERFGDKLKYRIDVQNEELFSCEIPRLCLEPIVENAVIHGIEPKLEGGTVDIIITKSERDIYMTVVDNGRGFHKKEIKEKKTGNSIGITNTDKRLKLIYGEQYGVFIDFEMKTGAKVVIKIPYEKGDNNV